MPQTPLTKLRIHLRTRYNELRGKLERIVGSHDDAADAMQETWVKLETMTDAGPVRNADAYLLRMATNIVTDDHRRKNFFLSDGELDQLIGSVPDETADPARIVAAYSELEALDAALAQLPARRRAMLLAARLDGLSNKEIAQKFVVSVSSVEKELRHAIRFCKDSMADSELAQLPNQHGPRKY